MRESEMARKGSVLQRSQGQGASGFTREQDAEDRFPPKVKDQFLPKPLLGAPGLWAKAPAQGGAGRGLLERRGFRVEQIKAGASASPPTGSLVSEVKRWSPGTGRRAARRGSQFPTSR